MKAQDEQQALEHMGSMFKRHGGKLSGRNKDWVGKKVAALNVLLVDASRGGPPDEHAPLSFVDFGIGDMDVWHAWAQFVDGQVDYVGVDGCGVILEAAMQRHPDMEFIAGTFSDVAKAHEEEGYTWPVDCLVALDVLYHVPDDDVYDGMLRVLFDDSGTHRYVLVSYATGEVQRFADAKGVGHPGFAWFPRTWQEPMGWELLHRADFVGVQNQQLSLYKRA